MIDLEIKQLAAKYKTGETNPVKVIDHCLSRIEAHEIKLSAFELVLADQARDAAETAAKAFSSGNRMGLFHGIPFALKDLVDVEGHVTTGGSNAYANRVATATAPHCQAPTGRWRYSDWQNKNCRSRLWSLGH